MITLGIIGVVAAMTLPTLIQNHQKQTYVTALKKAYSNIQNAFAQMALDEGVTEWKQTACYNVGLYDCGGYETGQFYIFDDSNNCLNNLQKQFKVISINSKLSQLIGIPAPESDGEAMTLVTTDGIIYTFRLLDGAEIDDVPSGWRSGWLLGIGDINVDINGDKGPNKWGRDRFGFNVDWSKNKIEPYGLSNYQTYCTPEKLKQNETNGEYCTAKVLIEGKMDY